jgi:hypothetical protein
MGETLCRKRKQAGSVNTNLATEQQQTMTEMMDFIKKAPSENIMPSRILVRGLFLPFYLANIAVIQRMSGPESSLFYQLGDMLSFGTIYTNAAMAAERVNHVEAPIQLIFGEPLNLASALMLSLLQYIYLAKLPHFAPDQVKEGRPHSTKQLVPLALTMPMVAYLTQCNEGTVIFMLGSGLAQIFVTYMLDTHPFDPSKPGSLYPGLKYAELKPIYEIPGQEGVQQPQDTLRQDPTTQTPSEQEMQLPSQSWSSTPRLPSKPASSAGKTRQRFNKRG